MTEGGEGGNTLKDPDVARKHAENTSKAMIGVKRNFSKQQRKWLSNNMITNAIPQAIQKNLKPCIVEGIHFKSLRDASKEFDISQQTISYRLKTNKPGYAYLSKEEN